MSPTDTKRLGDLHELPACAPAGLKALFTAAEGIIQTQVELLGSGTPSQAPDLRQLLRKEGIAKPEDQSMMIDQYSDHKDEVKKATSGIHRKDDGIVVKTAGIGQVLTKAYNAIDTSVGQLNDKIDASHNAVRTVTDSEGDPVRDEKGNVKKELPKHIVDGLFTGVWDTLNTSYTQVSGVSDRAAAEALEIHGDKPAFTATSGGNGGGEQPVSYPSSGNTGTTPWSADSGSMGTAMIPSGDAPTAMAMMKYLIDEHGFTPAQAAGIVANAKFESGFNVGATGDNGTARGLFQWRFGRQAGLREFARQPGEDIGDWKTHIDYMVKELRGGSSYQQAETLIDSNKNDPRAVAEAFDRYYEISSGSTINDRRKYAAGLLDEWNNAKSNVAV
ncbi:phage tail tip lysozyme [Nocardia niwae]|uniref:Phage tail tip lysozyme n=1 Tax=Nocardia niwae TaxID=626084 RepID=A0ABV2XGQ9_9NOCA